MPRVVAVSLAQYFSAGVPARSRAVLLLEIVLERCWIYTNLGVLLQLVSIKFEAAYPWFFVFRWHGVQFLRLLSKVLVPLRLPLWISTLSLHCRVDAYVLAILLLEHSDCHVLNGHIQVVFFDERVVHVGIVPDHVEMASLHCVQRSVPAALDGFDLVLLVEQPFEGTHLAGGFDCLPNSTYCLENRG